ncbi:7-cyano-7-deazaguanine synthase QueC [Rickettsia montanensis]|uniref:7-cyano-7-deazaguanine synthase n=1 Tax=Rickettsia montanensis (strain OSU 85-930) TaxID=1105114 RepID=H8KCG8_RICMS|nr:7-cyano-7-deazaguanine synthase QueC [Rickettsia montanensis]AFC73426.1 trans-regulatory protein exsB [Rickettsia montanensis str. OSU 85-930]
MKKKAVILLSGGPDSTTVLEIVSKMDYEIYALSFNYHRRNGPEVQKIQGLIKDYNVKQHRVINIDLQSFIGSALTDDNIDVPKFKNTDQLPSDIPVTYVPARNTIFLSYALGVAEVIGARDIFIGVHTNDYTNYPDCRPEYIKFFEAMANLATRVGVNGEKITVHAPLINMTKEQIIKKGLELGVDYSKTISCYDPTEDGLSCGQCLSCIARLDAFKKNNVQDPIKYV